MTRAELLLVELVNLGESPLYSAMAWLASELDRPVEIGEFLTILGGLVERDIVRLWSVDRTSHDRTELYAVPAGLVEKYQRSRHVDQRFDPFGLSLTIGPAATEPPAPPWEVEWSIERGEFSLRAEPSEVDRALAAIAERVLDRRLVVVETNEKNGKVFVRGRITPK